MHPPDPDFTTTKLRRAVENLGTSVLHHKIPQHPLVLHTGQRQPWQGCWLCAPQPSPCKHTAARSRAAVTRAPVEPALGSVVAALGVPTGALAAARALPALGCLAAGRRVAPPGSRCHIAACRERDEGRREAHIPATHPAPATALGAAAWVMPSRGVRRRMGTATAASPPEHHPAPMQQQQGSAPSNLHMVLGKGHSKPWGYREAQESHSRKKPRSIHQQVLSTHQTPNALQLLVPGTRGSYFLFADHLSFISETMVTAAFAFHFHPPAAAIPADKSQPHTPGC